MAPADTGETIASRVGKRGNLRHSGRADLRQGGRSFPRGVMMPVLRFIAVALLTSSSAVTLGTRAIAEPLEKAACLNLQVERKKLLTREMQAALDHGPDWVKNHLDSGEIEKVRQFLAIEEMIEFRCRGGGVAKVPITPPGAGLSADAVSLPDRNPNREAAAPSDAKPSQTVADSDKTAPSKTKATR